MLGYGHVVVPITSSVRRTATYAVCNLLEATVRLKITLTRFQLQPARYRQVLQYINMQIYGRIIKHDVNNYFDIIYHL